MYKTYRQIRDVLLQRLRHDPDDMQLTEREWMTMAFNLFCNMRPAEQNMYEETLIDIIVYLRDGDPFQKKPHPYQRIGDQNEFKLPKRTDMEKYTYYRKRILRHFELLGFLEPQRFGRFLFLKPLSFFESLKHFLDDHAAMVREKYTSAFYLELDDNPDEETAALYENSLAKGGGRTLIKKFYRIGKPYLLLRFLMDHEHEKRDFEEGELFKAVGVKSKGEKKLQDWIKALQIDEGISKGRYIKFVEDKIRFRSGLVEGLAFRKQFGF